MKRKEERFRHLDASMRRTIEAGLSSGESLSSIASRLGVATSTVSREAKRNRRNDGPSRKAGRDKNDCAFLKAKTCKRRNLCEIKGCGLPSSSATRPSPWATRGTRATSRISNLSSTTPTTPCARMRDGRSAGSRKRKQNEP